MEPVQLNSYKVKERFHVSKYCEFIAVPGLNTLPSGESVEVHDDNLAPF